MSVKQTLLDESMQTLERNLTSGLSTTNELTFYVLGYLYSRGIPIQVDEAEQFVLSYVNSQVEV